MQNTTGGVSAAQNAPQGSQFAPERIALLARLLTEKMSKAIDEIDEINDRTHLLSLNARIESARAGGEAGAAFGVVASAIKGLSEKSSQVAIQMASETQTAISELERISSELVFNMTNAHGVRLADLALTNIELIDRNLYERSCDARWWATDSSLGAALREPSTETLGHCVKRLATILRAYTVYFDLVVCDLNGKVIANGRPDTYRSVGTDCSRAAWFRAALTTKDGLEFGFEGVHASPLANGKRVLVYSCAIRDNGESSGEIVGVLGILLNWDSLAQTVVGATPIEAENRETTRVCIMDDTGLILADTEQKQLQETLDLRAIQSAVRSAKGHAALTLRNGPHHVGYAKSPGYETYATGWHSLVLQKSVSSGSAASERE